MQAHETSCACRPRAGRCARLTPMCAETVPELSTNRAITVPASVSSRCSESSVPEIGYGVTLAEHNILPDVEFDIQQAARHLDHSAWSAIASAEGEISARARTQLAPIASATSPGAVASLIGLALRSLEGVLRFGRPSFGARDA